MLVSKNNNQKTSASIKRPKEKKDFTDGDKHPNLNFAKLINVMHQPRPSGRQAKVPTVTLSAGAGMVQTFCQESRCSTTLWGKKKKEKIIIGAFS